ncbi:Type III effector HopAB2 [Pseudomonas ficuserectae]|nr:Type III effector HopAB2 [Pseudomonas ficuserectae]RMS34537.1 Type III effector HopAB2 [Pseudomonas ficuserectae]RMS39112.1 Type III effector HopAB2 [Pseudomonas ficuserectae]
MPGTQTTSLHQGARESSSGANSSNSPQVPPPPSEASASQARDRRERLLRSRPLSRETREWLEQGMPPTAEAEVRSRPHGSADAAAPHAPAETRPRPQHAGVMAHANSIVQQLVSAGADLAHTRTTLRNIMRGEEMALSRAEQSILREHFPNMIATGINPHSELAIELRHALRRADRQQAASTPARTPTRPPAARTPTQSSSSSSQRSLFGRFARLMTPDQRRSSNASTSQTPVDRSPPRVNQVPIRPDRAAMRNRGNNQAAAALQGLVQQGVNLEDLRTALERHLLRHQPIPLDIAYALQSVGIPPSVDTAESLVESPLMDLSVALHRVLGPRPVSAPPRPAVPMHPPAASRRPDGARSSALRVIPEREDYENNVAYGMRLLNLNPGVGGRRVVAVFITDPAARPAVVDDIRAARDPIPSQFNQLRTVSKAVAESQNPPFMDAAHHHPDDATHCLFGEPLSLENSPAGDRPGGESDGHVGALQSAGK